MIRLSLIDSLVDTPSVAIKKLQPNCKYFSAKFITNDDQYIYRPRSEASEGYVSTGVCHYVTERGGGGEGGVATPKTSGQHLPPPGTWSQHPLPPTTVNGRAVRILLECILVKCLHPFE